MNLSKLRRVCLLACLMFVGPSASHPFGFGGLGGGKGTGGLDLAGLPIGSYPIWKFHKFDGLSLKPVPIGIEVGNGIPTPPPQLLQGLPDMGDPSLGGAQSYPPSQPSQYNSYPPSQSNYGPPPSYGGSSYNSPPSYGSQYPQSNGGGGGGYGSPPYQPPSSGGYQPNYPPAPSYGTQSYGAPSSYGAPPAYGAPPSYGQQGPGGYDCVDCGNGYEQPPYGGPQYPPQGGYDSPQSYQALGSSSFEVTMNPMEAGNGNNGGQQPYFAPSMYKRRRYQTGPADVVKDVKDEEKARQ